MKITLKKLDRRYNGHGKFTHRAEFRFGWGQERAGNMRRFCEIRNYLWDMFGPSAEQKFINHISPTPKWAWKVDEYSVVIYLNEEAYTTFVLMQAHWQQS